MDGAGMQIEKFPFPILVFATVNTKDSVLLGADGR
jgi:hypothetical protein